MSIRPSTGMLLRLPAGVRSHIERELYTFPMTVQAIAERRRYVIEGGDGRELVDGPLKRSSLVWSDPTYFAGTALCEDRLLREMERIVTAIQETLEHPALRPEVKEAATRLYGLNGRRMQTPHRVSEDLCVSPAHLYRWRAMILVAIAARLGWL